MAFSAVRKQNAPDARATLPWLLISFYTFSMWCNSRGGRCEFGSIVYAWISTSAAWYSRSDSRFACLRPNFCYVYTSINLLFNFCRKTFAILLWLGLRFRHSTHTYKLTVAYNTIAFSGKFDTEISRQILFESRVKMRTHWILSSQKNKIKKSYLFFLRCHILVLVEFVQGRRICGLLIAYVGANA